MIMQGAACACSEVFLSRALKQQYVTFLIDVSLSE